MAQNDPIAVIGIGCRFPGSGNSGGEFWRSLNAGRDMFSPVTDRWPVASHYDASGRTPGKMYTLAAGLIDGLDLFDASFFEIPAVEAEAMDPQQRLLLEVSWHALEDAGIDPHGLRKSSTAVIVGATTDDYARLHGKSGLPVNAFSGLGVAKSMSASRLAYFYDLNGPVLQIDTTCSSALVAAHLAARELREGSCDLALVGGVNAIAGPDTTIGFCEMRALSPSGQLRAFDDAADGYVRGEGCGMLVLKRYADALRDGDRVRALLLGSAVNHDGRTNGLTAPNPIAQIQVLKRALGAAGCRPDDVHYVEAHGTGTPIGDLIETRALGEVYGKRATPLRIGSVKANVGHLEAGAAAAGLIKVILSFEHGHVPGQVNFDKPNQRVAWDKLRLDISSNDWQYPASEEWRAGISSFGMSGTNAHMVLAAPPRRPDRAAARPILPMPPILTVSAQSADSLRCALAGYSERLEVPGASPMSLAQGSQLNRAHFPRFRRAFRIGPAAELGALRRSAGEEPKPVVEPEREELVFVFNGQGTHAPGMAGPFYRDSAAFRASFDLCAAIFERETGHDLVDLCGKASQHAALARTELLQPALVAMGISLARLWISLGISPGAVIGHSIGEFAAAVTAGSLSVAEAMELACERGRAVARHARPGLLLAVMGRASSIEALPALLPPEASVAAYNSPQQILVACPGEAEAACRAAISAANCRATRLPIDYAFHSPAMRDAAEAVAEAFGRVPLRPPEVEWIGAAGREGQEQPWRDSSYFLGQMTAPVGFDRAVRKLLDRGYGRFLEIGPDCVLQASMRATAGSAPFSAAWTMRNGAEPWPELGGNLARLYEMGVDPDWQSLWEGEKAQPDLPLYAFSRRRYWLPLPAADRAVAPATASMGFRPELVSHEGDTRRLRLRIDPAAQPHLLEHSLFGKGVVAGASWISLWMQVGRDLLGTSAIAIDSLKLLRPLLLAAPEPPILRLELKEESPGRFAFAAYPEASSALPYCQGVLAADGGAPAAALPEDWGLRAPADYKSFYERFEARGYHVGPGFKWLDAGREGAGAAVCELKPPLLPADADCYAIFPGLVDSCFHALAGLLAADVSLGPQELAIPAELDGVRLFPGAETRQAARVYAFRTRPDGTPLPSRSGRLLLCASDDTPLLEIGSVEFRKIAAAALERSAASAETSGGERLSFQSEAWRPIEFRGEPGAAQPIEIRADSDFSAATLSRRLNGSCPDRWDFIVVAPESTEEGDGDPAARIAARSVGWIEFFNFVGGLRQSARVRILAPGAAGGDGSAGFCNAALAGLWLTAAAEYPKLSVVIADPGPAFEEALDRLRRGDLGEAPTGLYRLGRAGWEESFWQDERGPGAAELDLEGRAAIVTGGGGALAPHFAAWLLERGASNVYLLGRSAAGHGGDAGLGHRSRYVQCDVTDEAAVREVFRAIESLGEKVGAIVHAAGELADHPLFSLGEQDICRTLAPKLTGARILERCWRAEHLKLVLAVSSIAALKGSANQAAYVVANRALDGWASELRARGLPVVSLNLGPVRAGMAARLSPAQEERLRRLGIALMSPDLIATAVSAAVGSAGQLAAFQRSIGDGPILLDGAQDLSGENVLAAIRGELSRLIGDGRPLRDDVHLTDIGVDSLLAAELSSWISTRYRIDLPLPALLSAPDLREAARVVEDLARSRGAPREEPAAAAWHEGVI